MEPYQTRCSKILYYLWKFITCVFSHTILISLVCAYCIGGAFTFVHLESQNEKEVKRSIAGIRHNVSEAIWTITTSAMVLREDYWIGNVTKTLRNFETSLLQAIKKDGWDGIEDEQTVQWTFTGALFYSIIVITTIGYGHIAPKTPWGKITTIVYAVLGIPLMLLCLSNIGDIMATSFRFLYWKVCCYVCTKRPKKRRTRAGNRSLARQSTRRPVHPRSQSVKGRQKSNDSGLARSEMTLNSYNNPSGFNERTGRRYDSQAITTMSVPTGRKFPNTFNDPNGIPLGGSLDRRQYRQKYMRTAGDNVGVPMLPITDFYCNTYAIDREEQEQMEVNQKRRAQSVPPKQYLEPYDDEDDHDDFQRKGSQRKGRRKHSPSHHNPSPRIMSPMGFPVHRQHYDSYSDEEFTDDAQTTTHERRHIRPVPIWLCVFLVVGYIVCGAFLFSKWEDWLFLDAAYFCFITLTTIGFGDFVPAKRVSQDAREKALYCLLYILFGIALLAMSFNLVQEEVIANVKSVAKRLGILKDDDEDEDDD